MKRLAALLFLVAASASAQVAPVWVTWSDGWLYWNGNPVASSSYNTIQIGGSAQPQEPALNLIAGTNITLTPTDTPGVSTNVTIASTGGGGSTPTGTGFTHITGGVQDGAAKTVDVSSSDVTGTLAAARFGALTGDVTSAGGSYTTTIANNAVTLAKFATQAANTVVANVTASTAVPTAASLPSCVDSGGNHLNYTNGTGFSCGTTGTGGSVMVASGASHAAGLAPDPGATAGTGRILDENATWVPYASIQTHYHCLEEFTGYRGSGTDTKASGNCGFGHITNTNSATGQQSNSPITVVSDHPGQAALGMGTSAGGDSNEVSGGDYIIGGGETIEYMFNIPVLSNSTDRFHVELGVYDQQAASAIQEGAYLTYEDDVNSGNWQYVTCHNNSCTTSNASSGPTANTWYRLTITVNAANTSVAFAINGVSLGTANTTNLSSTNGVRMGFRITRTSGTTNDRNIVVDYASYDRELTR